MAKLTPAQRQDRLRFDYLVVSKMQSPFMSVTAYRSVEEMKARRNPIGSRDEGHLALHYIADYKIKTLIGEDRYSSGTSIHFDLLAKGDYPFSEPNCWVISNDIPWTPHFTKGETVCLGEIWKESKGSMLLGHLLVHVAKLLNFDEIPRSPNYNGYNGAAVRYWRTKLNMQPITPGLAYPVLPDIDELLSGGDNAFKPKAPGLAASDIFQAKSVVQPLNNVFQARQANPADRQPQAMPTSSVFAPSPRKNQ